MNATDKHPFPTRAFLVGGLLCAVVIPIIITMILNVRYGNASALAQAIQIYLLIFANLILSNFHTYISRLLYAKGNKKTEVLFSSIFVVITIVAVNWIFLNNFYLRKTTSTAILILFVVPLYGSVSIIAGYLAGGAFKRLRR